MQNKNRRLGLTRRTLFKAGAAGLLATPAIARRSDAAGPAIRVLLVGDPFYYALNEVVDQFKAASGINAQVESLAYSALEARLVSSFIAHKPDADVIAVDQMWTGQYLDNGWITALDDMIKADKSVDITDIIPQAFYSQSTWRGHVATLPVATYGQGVMYRKDVFDGLKLTLPPPADFTWDSYVALVRAIHGKTIGKTKFAGTVLAGEQPQPIVHMYTQLAVSRGVDWFKHFPASPWDFTPTIDTPQNVAALTMFKELYQLSPPAAINYNWFDAGMRFAHGDVGVMFWWTPYFYLTHSDGYMTGKPSPVADMIGYATLPHDPKVPQTISIGGWGLGIPANTRNRNAAWEFVKWACSAKAQKAMGLVTKYGHQYSDFPRASLYRDADLLKIYPYLPLQYDLLQHGDGKKTRPPCPIYTTLEGIYGLDLNRTLAGDSTPAQALSNTRALFMNALQGNFLLPYKLESYDDTLAATEKLIASLA